MLTRPDCLDSNPGLKAQMVPPGKVYPRKLKVGPRVEEVKVGRDISIKWSGVFLMGHYHANRGVDKWQNSIKFLQVRA